MFTWLKEAYLTTVQAVKYAAKAVYKTAKALFSFAKEKAKENPKTALAIAAIGTGWIFFVFAGPIAAYLGKKGLLGLAGTGTEIITLNGQPLVDASLKAIGFGISVKVGVAVITTVGAVLGFGIGWLVTKLFKKRQPELAMYNEGVLLLN
ncbi:hypothetical protein [Vibrio paucivorans]